MYSPPLTLLFRLSIIPLAFFLPLNTFSFFPPPHDDLHEDLHLNGCGEHINNTYTNPVKVAQYLLLSDMNGGKNSMNVLKGKSSGNCILYTKTLH